MLRISTMSSQTLVFECTMFKVVHNHASNNFPKIRYEMSMRINKICSILETTDALMRHFDSGGMPYNLVVIGYYGQPVLHLTGQPDCCGSGGVKLI